jgi:hypothetical protein
VENDFIMMARKLIVARAENVAQVVREDLKRKRRWSPGTGNGKTQGAKKSFRW